MATNFDNRIGAMGHQLVGCALGIIFCAWWTGAAPEQVAVIRLPSTLVLTVYIMGVVGYFVASLYRARAQD